MKKYLLILPLLFIWAIGFSQLDVPFLNEHAAEIIEEEGSLLIRNTAEAEMTIKRRITILNDQSRANVLTVYHDPENKILDFDVGIYDLAGESIRRVKNSEIRDYAAVDGFSVYNDSRVQVLELNYSQYPYVIEVEYRQRIRGINFAGLPNWYFQGAPTSAVVRSHFTLRLPSEMNIQYRPYNAEVTPVIERSGNWTNYSWEMTNIPAFERESYAPAYHRLLPILRLTPHDIEVEQYTGSMATWVDYGHFKALLYEGRDILPPNVQQSIRSLTEDLESDSAKINTLYRYLQDNFRYVSVQLGIGGWQPFDATFVSEQGYGDCKALSNYMKAMLDVVGIESYPVSVYAGRDAPYAIEDDFVDPAFNHVILYVPEHDYWLECTSSNAPPNYLGAFCNDRRVLLVTPEGGRITNTPKLGAEENVEHEMALISLAVDGSATITYDGQFSGIDHERWRSMNTHLSSQEIEDEIHDFSSLPTLDFGDSSLEISPDQPEARLRFSATAGRYAARVGKRLFVPLNAICPRETAPNAVQNRQSPVCPSYGYTERAIIRIELPPGFQMESLPDSIISLHTDFATYELRLHETGTNLEVERLLIVQGEELPADRYDEFRQFFMEVVRHDGAKMVLVAE